LPGLRQFRVAGGSQEWAVALLGVHTSSRNPRPIQRIQAYIAYTLRLRCGFGGRGVALWWVISGRRISLGTGTIQIMDIQNNEVWDRLENEPERAYRAFESFLALPGGERTLLEAYRQHVGNPDAAKPPIRGVGGRVSSPGGRGPQPTTTTLGASDVRLTSR
jgi:hypothetical protein